MRARAVYVCWSVFHRSSNTTTTHTQIVFKRIYPALATKVIANETYSNGGQIGCNIAIGTGGEVYVAWHDYQTGGPDTGKVRFRWNDGAGADVNWNAATSLATFRRFNVTIYCKNVTGMGNRDCIQGNGNPFRIGFMPGLAVDMKGGVHVVYADNVTTGSSKHGDILYMNSDNCKGAGGCTWSTAITINRDTTNRDQFIPWIHLSNITSSSNPRGTIYVVALDRRDDSNNINWKVWSYTCAPGSSLGCRSSSDRANIVVSDRSIHNHAQTFIGDYNGITHTKTRESYPLWIDDLDYDNNKKFDVKGDWSKR